MFLLTNVDNKHQRWKVLQINIDLKGRNYYEKNHFINDFRSYRWSFFGRI